MPAPDRGGLADTVARIVTEAAALAHGQWGGVVASWDKRPGELVSAVDLAVDDFLRQRLSALVPEAAWLSEESAASPGRADRALCWVVDPIDGTRDFIRGRSGWAVSVALVDGGAPVLGVLAAPARNENWVAIAGAGAWLNDRRLRSSQARNLAGARVPADALPRIDRDLVPVAKPNGIALRIALVAADQADCVATTRWGFEWDIAAAVLIAREAGATVTDAHGAPIRFNQVEPRVFGVLATAPALHQAALARFGVAPLRV